MHSDFNTSFCFHNTCLCTYLHSKFLAIGLRREWVVGITNKIKIIQAMISFYSIHSNKKRVVKVTVALELILFEFIF